MRSLWTRFRTRELLWGVVYGSLAAVMFDLASRWLIGPVGRSLWKRPDQRSNCLTHPSRLQWSAIFCLILPRFCRKSSLPLSFVAGRAYPRNDARLGTSRILVLDTAKEPFVVRPRWNGIRDCHRCAWDPHANEAAVFAGQIAEWIPHGAEKRHLRNWFRQADSDMEERCHRAPRLCRNSADACPGGQRARNWHISRLWRG